MTTVLDMAAYYHILQIIRKRPLDINIETTNICPMKCAFCCNRVYQRPLTVMDLALFEDIVRQYYQLGGGALGLSSMQSDLFSDPMLLKRIKILKKYKGKLWIYTTTPLISCKRFSDKELLYILRIFDCLQISIEGHDPESYRVMGGVDGFAILKEQLERINKIIKGNSLRIRVDLCFRTYQKKELLESEFFKEISSIFHVYNIKDTFFTWFGTVRNKDLPQGAKAIVRKNVGKKENCSIPNTSLAVMANGEVVGCGCIDWLGKYIVGDCKENTLQEIWRSHRAVRFRKAFQIGRLPSICRECDAYVSMQSMKSKKLLRYQPTDGLYYLVRRDGVDNHNKGGQRK